MRHPAARHRIGLPVLWHPNRRAALPCDKPTRLEGPSKRVSRQQSLDLDRWWQRWKQFAAMEHREARFLAPTPSLCRADIRQPSQPESCLPSFAAKARGPFRL